jgi:hypothetical protein
MQGACVVKRFNSLTSNYKHSAPIDTSPLPDIHLIPLDTSHGFAFLRLVYPMLPASLDCLFLIAPSVFSNVYLNWLTLCMRLLRNENYCIKI